MANPTRIEGDVYVSGNLAALTFTPPAGCITDNSIAAGANEAATKLEHQYEKVYAQNGNAVSAADKRCIHHVYGATGSIVAFEAGSITACTGNATITVDLTKGGVSVLSAPIVLDSTNTARVAESGTISSAVLTDGDCLEVVVTVNAGTGALGYGIFASCIIREKAQ